MILADRVDNDHIVHQKAEEWLSYGRDYQETHFSPLTQINDQTVGQLGLAWAIDLPVLRGFEATPLFHDGVIYTTGPRGIVWAVDARLGKILWQYDPKPPLDTDRKTCCDVGNRGVALWGDKVYVGTLDGRLTALNTKTGSVVWQTQTLEPGRDHTMTGAPRVVKGMVLIGFGGADMSGARGYLSAYDSETGKLRWRFYTVPGDPAKPFENKAMEAAAKTWQGEGWKYGGGGTVWDGMAYDPDLDLVYFGVGNGFPWNKKVRSPGQGDNLYTSSIMAVKAETGELVWYYQSTPGETWDYTAAQPMILADLNIEGQTRKVIMQAPKNGFFYVIDRKTGELISAEKFTKANWAFSIDKKTGRPIEVPGVRYQESSATLTPGPMGAHNWQPMAYNPITGLVYIPAMSNMFNYANEAGSFKIIPGNFNSSVDIAKNAEPEIPPDFIKKRLLNGDLIAWDPVKQKSVWKAHHPYMWNSGVLSTAGHLVFQGTAEGTLLAYQALTGKLLWKFDAQTGISATPITYTLEGKQYITVMVGSAGSGSLLGSLYSRSLPLVPRLLTFELGATQQLPALTHRASREKPPILTASKEEVQAGFKLYNQHCVRCHGVHAVGGGVIADLRYASPSKLNNLEDIVLKGVFLARGMPRFDDVLTEKDVQAIKAFLIAEANKAYAAQKGEEE